MTVKNCENCDHPMAKHKPIMADSMKRCQIALCTCKGDYGEHD